MGAVYRATGTRLNRDVAVKILPPAFAEDTGRVQRFEREAQVLASLNHPNIAAIYGIEQGAIVMELVEGANLAGPVAVDTAIGYARQIALGLEAAHEKGIVHRDEFPRGLKAQVPIHHFAAAACEHHNAAAQAIGGGVVLAGIAGVEDELVDGPVLQLLRCQRRNHTSPRRKRVDLVWRILSKGALGAGLSNRASDGIVRRFQNSEQGFVVVRPTSAPWVDRSGLGFKGEASKPCRRTGSARCETPFPESVEQPYQAGRKVEQFGNRRRNRRQ